MSLLHSVNNHSTTCYRTAGMENYSNGIGFPAEIRALFCFVCSFPAEIRALFCVVCSGNIEEIKQIRCFISLSPFALIMSISQIYGFDVGQLRIEFIQ